MRVPVSRELLLLVAVAAVVGVLFARLESEPPPLRGHQRSEGLELVHHPIPDLGRALPADKPEPGFARDLFVEPSDTRPLPPLEWQEPPRPELASVSPPPVPGPSPAWYGRFLRREAEPVGAPTAADRPQELFGIDEPAEDARDDGEGGVRAALREFGRSGDFGGESELDETPEERAARVASYRRLYDHLQLGGAITLFGSIENDDPPGLFLGGREEEPIAFLEFDPRTALEKYPGQGPILYERSRVTDLGLAENRANEIELRARRLRVSSATAPAVLAFAARCIEARHEAPRALDIARDLLERLAEVEPDDPAPRIGLAHCHEAAFELEAAFEEYRRLLERFPHRSEVLVALAELERSCLMVDSAEARLREALRIDRTSWRAHWILGRLLAERGEHEQALEQLEAANRNAPEDPATLTTRVEMRTDLAAEHVARGEVPEAVRELELARRLDPLDQGALAALVSCAVLDPVGAGLGPVDGTLDAPEELLEPWLRPIRDAGDEAGDQGEARGLGFELLLALGTWDLAHGDLERARVRLAAAAEADPLRAHLAWRASSTLAERAGNAEEAQRFVEKALEGDPRDVWSHYQRGRLLARVDELEEARASFETALRADLDFDDALVAMGELLFRIGAFDEAMRYLERALSREPDRAELHTLQGLVKLRTGAFFEARAAFRRALELAPGDPVALGGSAWCTYRAGDPAEALVLLAELDDSRRRLPESDPYRVWAREQIARLTDHLEKVAWTDGFTRTSLRNGWQVDEGAGPLVELVDGAVHLSGSFQRPGVARLYREYPANAFISVEASLWIPEGSPVRAGLFVSRERRRQRAWQTESEATIARHRDGLLEVRIARTATEEPEVVKADAIEFPTGRWVRVRIERTGEPERPALDVFLEGVAVVRDAAFPELGRGAQPIRVGVFVEGDTGRQVDLRVDEVEVVFREGDR